MSTQSIIGVKFGDKIIGCSVHYDGYPENMIPTLNDFIEKYSTTGLVVIITEGGKRGGMRSFNTPDGDWVSRVKGEAVGPRKTDFIDGQAYVITEENWSHDHASHHRYLVDYDTGRITHQEGDKVPVDTW